jgi:hypothetical protein
MSELVLTVADFADVGVIRDDDDAGVERPRPLGADGAFVGLLPVCSAC